MCLGLGNNDDDDNDDDDDYGNYYYYYYYYHHHHRHHHYYYYYYPPLKLFETVAGVCGELSHRLLGVPPNGSSGDGRRRRC